MLLKGSSGHHGAELITRRPYTQALHAYKYGVCRLEMKPVDTKDELRGLEITSAGGFVLCAIL